MVKRIFLIMLIVLGGMTARAQKGVQVEPLSSGGCFLHAHSLPAFKLAWNNILSVGLSCHTDSANVVMRYLHVYGCADVDGDMVITLSNGFDMTLNPSFGSHCRSRLGLIKERDIYWRFYPLSEAAFRDICEVGVAEIKVLRADEWLVKTVKDNEMGHWLKWSDEQVAKRLAKMRKQRK